MKNYTIVPIEDYQKFEDFSKNRFFQTVFIDEVILSHAIRFYNQYFRYIEHPIDREEALIYAKLGTCINSEFFRTIRPKNEEQLNQFYRLSPFHFFNNIIRFMDGMHRDMGFEFLERGKSPILDFAGGTGGFSLFLAKKGLDVTFVESSIICLEWMKYITNALGLKVAIHDSNDKLDRKFKLIIAKDVVEHVVDPGGLNDYLSSLLDVDGSVFSSVYPCCGPDEMAPMHFWVGYKDKNIEYSVEDNLAQLSGKTVSSNTM